MNQTLLAQISNPAVPALSNVSGDSATFGATVLGRYIGILIQTSAVLGGLAVLLYMFMGALQWITAGGDTGKIDKARGRMLQAIIGLAVLVSVVAIVSFIGPVFGLDLLAPTFINQLDNTVEGGGVTFPASRDLSNPAPQQLQRVNPVQLRDSQ
jgi:hypothetical protein